MSRDRPFDLRDHMVGPAGMLGAAANVVLQLGSPGVGYGVVESKVDSGNVMIHPWKRLRTTLSYLVVALFGSEADRAAYREAVNRSHRAVHSDESSPVAYNAFDPELQLWVAACLYVGVRDARLLLGGPLSEADADGLYAECARLGTSLQVRPEMWPADRAAFEDYWTAGLARIRYDEPVREHLMKVVELRMVPRWMQLGNARVNRFFTTGFLPPEARAAMRLDWSERDQRRFDRWMAVFRLFSRLQPRWVRMLPIYVSRAEIRLRIRRGWKLT